MSDARRELPEQAYDAHQIAKHDSGTHLAELELRQRVVELEADNANLRSMLTVEQEARARLADELAESKIEAIDATGAAVWRTGQLTERETELTEARKRIEELHASNVGLRDSYEKLEDEWRRCGNQLDDARKAKTRLWGILSAVAEQVGCDGLDDAPDAVRETISGYERLQIEHSAARKRIEELETDKDALASAATEVCMTWDRAGGMREYDKAVAGLQDALRQHGGGRLMDFPAQHTEPEAEVTCDEAAKTRWWKALGYGVPVGVSTMEAETHRLRNRIEELGAEWAAERQPQHTEREDSGKTVGAESERFGARVRDARERHGKTLRETAAHIGWSAVQLGEVERGVRDSLPDEQWRKLVEFLPSLRRPAVKESLTAGADQPGATVYGGDGPRKFLQRVYDAAWTAKQGSAADTQGSCEPPRLASLAVRMPDGAVRWLANEVRRLCDRVVWCQSSRRSGDLDADLDALEEQRAVVEAMLGELERCEPPAVKESLTTAPELSGPTGEFESEPPAGYAVVRGIRCGAVGARYWAELKGQRGLDWPTREQAIADAWRHKRAWEGAHRP